VVPTVAVGRRVAGGGRQLLGRQQAADGEERLDLLIDRIRRLT
jgi:hypothetical protein